MKIRPFEASDGAALTALYRRSVERIGPRDYVPAQVAAWAARAPAPARFEELARDGRVLLVAVEEAERPLGFADLEPDGHIHFLYCAPEAAGRGVAAALCAELERRARARGITRLYSEASEAARRFFLRQGFSVTARRDFEIAGVAIHNYAVEKQLADDLAG